MSNTITGRVYRITPTVEIKSKDGQTSFKKRELTLDATRYNPYTGEREFENYPTIEFGGEKCALLDNIKEGDIVTVSFDLSGTSYKDAQGTEKWFTRIRGYKVEKRQARQQGCETATAAPAATSAEVPAPMPVAQPDAPAQGTTDDLPF